MEVQHGTNVHSRFELLLHGEGTGFSLEHVTRIHPQNVRERTGNPGLSDAGDRPADLSERSDCDSPATNASGGAIQRTAPISVSAIQPQPQPQPMPQPQPRPGGTLRCCGGTLSRREPVALRSKPAVPFAAAFAEANDRRTRAACSANSLQFFGADVAAWFAFIERVYDVDADDTAYERWLDTPYIQCGKRRATMASNRGSARLKVA